eukprot:EC713961.1.p3 GENE.EC713961.1~~EC713961.1.p3  ORF type:complete len:55 (+),score=9.27 EC713961.1:51-215(+)
MKLSSVVWAFLQGFVGRLLTHVQQIGHDCYEMSSVDPVPTARDVPSLCAQVKPL